ncbi:hypothetical protein DITRI_Ditri01bG0041200 [Diplodiscus trichospermus]
MGGLGRTTLANKVYHHGRVRNNFKYFVWAYVSQQCQRKTIWKGILSSLGLIEDKGRILNLEEDDQELAERLHNFLKENKCLVVLDDIGALKIGRLSDLPSQWRRQIAKCCSPSVIRT